MGKKRPGPEQIVTLLRQIEVAKSQLRRMPSVKLLQRLRVNSYRHA
jgi:hypothetical protein